VLWYVVITKPSSEHIVMNSLQREMPSVEAYYPRVKRRLRHAGKTQFVERPFLARYLFVVDAFQSLVDMLHLTGIQNVIRCGDVPQKVSQEVVDAIRSREVHGFVKLVDEPVDHPFRQGDPVRVVGGAFYGFNAIFSQQQGLDRAQVFVNIMGRSTKTSIELGDLMKA